jgi:hypothetical protein
MQEIKMKEYNTSDDLWAKWEASEAKEKAERATFFGAIKHFFLDLYYGTCRAIRSVIDFPKEVKWFFQRGWNGYSDFDVWGFNSYLARIICGGLKELRKYKTGYPCMIIDENDMESDGNIKRDKFYRRKWKLMLGKMIFAFEMLANDKIDVVLNYDELKPRQIKAMAQTEQKFKHKMYSTKEESKQIREGLELFCKYFQCLWD